MVNKYKSKPTEVDNIRFASRKEAKRYIYLKDLEKRGRIKNLGLQTHFTLIPSQYIDGKCVERPAKYYADFTYTDVDTGEYVVEDTKGVRTPAYILKRKLMLQVHGIRIKEI